VKIILTNDDGIDAPGLQAAILCLRNVGDITVVAPASPQSGVGHRVTTKAGILVAEIGKNRFSVQGTPADCTRIALKMIAPDADWLVAGINPGANLGSDVYNSGTVAAAREAAILGCRAIAISQYIARSQVVDWEITRYHAEKVLQQLLDKTLEKGYFWNANLPHPLRLDSNLEYGFCDLDTHPHKYRFHREENTYVYEGIIHERPRAPGKDVAVCFGGRVSVSRIGIS
jgi:5'-nucleotidase